MARPLDKTERAMSAAREFAAAVAGAFDPERTLSLTLRRLRQTLDVDVTAVVLREPGQELLSVRECSGFEGTGMRIRPGGLLGSVIHSGRPEVVPDIQRDPRRDELTGKCGARRVMLYPLSSGERVLGAMMAGSLGTRASAAEDAADVALFSMFAEFTVAILAMEDRAFEEQRFHRSLSTLVHAPPPRQERGNEFDSMLLEISQKKNLSLETAGDCDPLLRDLCHLTGARAAAWAELDRGEYRITEAWEIPTRVAHDWSESQEDAREIHLAEGPTCVVPSIRSGFGSSFLRQDLRVAAPAGRRAILHVLSAGRFSPRDARLAENITLQLAGRIPVPATSDAAPTGNRGNSGRATATGALRQVG